MGKIQLTAIGSLFILMSACTEQVTPTPYQYTKVFTGQNSKTWKLKFLEQTLDGKVEETFNLTCASDDEYVFYANSERAYKASTGFQKCAPDESIVINDTWSFNNASATLTMVLPFFTESSLPFIVREAKKNKMELEIFLDEKNTASYRIHFESTSEQ
jgi:hypothetical protein